MTNKEISRRDFASGVVGASVLGSFTSVVRGKRKRNQAEKIQNIFDSWRKEHGSIVSVDGGEISKSDNRYRQQLIFDDGQIRTFTIQITSETTATVSINNQEYFVSGVPKSREEKRQLRSSIPEFGETNKSLKASNSSLSGQSASATRISKGDRITRRAADDYKYDKSGTGIGTRKNGHNLSQFRAECVCSGSYAFYGKNVTDVYFDVFIAEPSWKTVRLEADFNVDWEIATMAAGGTATCWGHCKIRDLNQNKNIVNGQVYSRNKYLVGIPRRYTGSARPIFGHNVKGQKRYRIGIRAYTEAEAWLTAWSTADTHTDFNENNPGEFFDVNSIVVRVE